MPSLHKHMVSRRDPLGVTPDNRIEAALQSAEDGVGAQAQRGAKKVPRDGHWYGVLFIYSLIQDSSALSKMSSLTSLRNLKLLI
jgi:hypothetical protein